MANSLTRSVSLVPAEFSDCHSLTHSSSSGRHVDKFIELPDLSQRSTMSKIEDDALDDGIIVFRHPTKRKLIFSTHLMDCARFRRERDTGRY